MLFLSFLHNLSGMTIIASVPTKLDIAECERLRELRGIRSRNALAVKSGINSSHLYRIFDEEVDPSIGTVDKLARALGVRVRDILKDEPDEPSP